MLHIEVLGPLHVAVRGVSIVPTAGKPRQLLALLAQHAGHIVSVPTLVEEIWGDEAPRSVSTTLQTYVLQVRRKITTALEQVSPGSGADAKALLTTTYGGYRLAAPERPGDAARFEELAGQGITALEAGDPRRASAVLRRALDLWRGPALVDVPVGRVLELEVLALDEARARALELRIEADLQLGRHATLIGELRVLTARQPLHEGHRAQLMLAFYRSGHPWRALETFQQLRAALREELGVEPSPRLQRLHQQVLSGAPQLERDSSYETFAS